MRGDLEEGPEEGENPNVRAVAGSPLGFTATAGPAFSPPRLARPGAATPALPTCPPLGGAALPVVPVALGLPAAPVMPTRTAAAPPVPLDRLPAAVTAAPSSFSFPPSPPPTAPAAPAAPAAAASRSSASSFDPAKGAKSTSKSRFPNKQMARPGRTSSTSRKYFVSATSTTSRSPVERTLYDRIAVSRSSRGPMAAASSMKAAE